MIRKSRISEKTSEDGKDRTGRIGEDGQFSYTSGTF
jgi:hypothetical protein